MKRSVYKCYGYFLHYICRSYLSSKIPSYTVIKAIELLMSKGTVLQLLSVKPSCANIIFTSVCLFFSHTPNPHMLYYVNI